MRFLLASLITLHAPVSAVAAVVERMPTIGIQTPAVQLTAPLVAPALSAAPALLAAPSVAPLATAPALAAAPAAVMPAVAAPPALAAQPAGMTARATLTNLGAKVGEAPKAGAALDRAFDFAKAAADGVEPTPETERAPTTGLQPAAAPRQAWRSAVPNALTFSNMASGLAAAFLASNGKFTAAALAIIAANLFDALDGRAARAFKSQSPLGIDLDSLADIVSFGVAPALLVFKAALLPALGWWGFPVAAAFAAGGLFRLARFNVGAHAEKAGAVVKKSDSFTGLPIPGGAGVVVAFTLALGAIPAAAVAPAAVAVTLLAAAAMVSRLPYPAFKKKGIGLALGAGVVAAAIPAALGAYALIPAAVFGLYLATGPAVALLRRGH